MHLPPRPPLPFYSLHNDESVHSRRYAKYHIEIDVLLKREHVRFNLTPVRPLVHIYHSCQSVGCHACMEKLLG